MATNLRWAGLVAALLAAIIVARAVAEGPADAAKPPAAAPADSAPRPRVTISKQTTFLTKPLRKDGYVDYIAALDDRCRAGVTPQNNAAVPFWQAVGPKEIFAADRDEYFKKLGIPPLPESGPYFVGPDKYLRQHAHDKKPGSPPADEKKIQAAQDFLDSGEMRPWSANEFPILAQWLAANEKPLGLLLEASARPRRYDPLISGKDQLVIAMLLPAISEHRSAARALVYRAMLHVREGKIAAAWEDLLAAHRLARLVGQGPTLVDGLVAMAVDETARDGDRAILQHTRLSAAALMRMQRDLDALPPMPKLHAAIDQAERFCFLDAVASCARARDASSAMFLAANGVYRNSSALQRALMQLVAEAIDWDLILRMGNSWYDRMAAAYAIPSRAERRAALAKIEADAKTLARDVKDCQSLMISMLIAPRWAISQRLGDCFISLLVPAITAVDRAEDRWAMQSEITRLGFAMAVYQADHGSYPAKLAELAPKYIAAVPTDLFTAKELQYRREGDGYLLYSVGPNGIDDGGLGADDCKNGEKWDDLVLRVPDSGKGNP